MDDKTIFSDGSVLMEDFRGRMISVPMDKIAEFEKEQDELRKKVESGEIDLEKLEQEEAQMWRDLLAKVEARRKAMGLDRKPKRRRRKK
jgi:septal ring factor EnvC (AmiA/AmiB activator)